MLDELIFQLKFGKLGKSFFSIDVRGLYTKITAKKTFFHCLCPHRLFCECMLSVRTQTTGLVLAQYS